MNSRSAPKFLPGFIIQLKLIGAMKFLVAALKWQNNQPILRFCFLFTAVSLDTGMVDAYQHMAPMVDTVTFLQWLYNQCQDKGCRFVQDEIHGLLSDQAEYLKDKYKARLIINCSGLSSIELAGDNEVYPSRG